MIHLRQMTALMNDYIAHNLRREKEESGVEHDFAFGTACSPCSPRKSDSESGRGKSAFRANLFRKREKNGFGFALQPLAQSGNARRIGRNIARNGQDIRILACSRPDGVQRRIDDGKRFARKCERDVFRTGWKGRGTHRPESLFQPCRLSAEKCESRFERSKLRDDQFRSRGRHAETDSARPGGAADGYRHRFSVGNCQFK